MPIYIGILMFAFSFVVLSVAKQYYLFVTAMVLLTIGEAFIFPQVPVIVNRITPEGVKGKYLGLVNFLVVRGGYFAIIWWFND